ncbi:MAG TPA: endonuclease/exonuclease/phosphatase family protein [Candidatus Elarobacter sp.]|jgi:exodeoxyribonuclease-3
MKIATYNVNGVNGRLPVLLEWLAEARPDVVCLQELKAPQEKLPEVALRNAGYGAIWLGQKSWNGVAILSRGETPVETRRGCPGEPDVAQSRYIEGDGERRADRLSLPAQRKPSSRSQVRLQTRMV